MNIVIEKEYSINNRKITIQNNSLVNINIKTINAILGILKLEKIKPVKDYFRNFLKDLNIKNNLEWHKLFTSKNKKMYLTHVISGIEDNKKYLTEYFLKVFPQRLKLFRMLTPVGSNEVPLYSHNSITGRLTITNGINYLTMKKELRNNLTSSLKDHTILELDFKSCEPNFYMRAKDLIGEEVEDIYTHISKEIGLDAGQERVKLKRSILSILYGANNSTVKRLSKMNTAQIEKIKSMLNVKSFEAELKKEFNKNGFIKNYYGRPILSDANIVNYWIQSSSVDYCCLSFLKFLQENQDAKLHAVIHDAILFSVPNNKIQVYMNIKSLNCPISNISIPIKININGLDN